MLLEYAEGFAQGHSCVDRAEARRPPNNALTAQKIGGLQAGEPKPTQAASPRR
jgi:hypothetical protein